MELTTLEISRYSNVNVSVDTSRDVVDPQKLAFFRGPVPVYFWVLSAINGTTTLVCNAVVIFIMLRRDRLYQNSANWLLLSLAFSDLTVGVIMIPSLFICYFSTTIKCDWDVNKKVFDLFLYISVANLSFLTMDRYIAVVFPFKYPLIITRQTTINLLITAWLFPLLVFIIPLIVTFLSIPNQEKVIVEQTFVVVKVSLFELLPSVLMLLAYLHIFRISRRHTKHINSILRSIRKSSTCETKWRAKSTIKVFCVVVPLFVICWSLAAWREICSTFVACSVQPTVVHVSRLLLKGHSMIDPIVYALHKKEIRKKLSKNAGCLALLQTTMRKPKTNSDNSGRRPRDRTSQFAQSSL